MPPSGFHKDQSLYVVSFLRSCLSDLSKEAAASSINCREAIKKEIHNIDSIFQKGTDGSQYQDQVLGIVKQFYQDVLKTDANAINADRLFAAGEKVLKEIDKQILSIKVPEIGKLGKTGPQVVEAKEVFQGRQELRS